ncbi:MAG: ABC transporter ATP-binding protein [Thermomicrobiales bacterium]|nr:ABC transporter ATP-binding protein [Thermomicrobiales bacterium]
MSDVLLRTENLSKRFIQSSGFRGRRVHDVPAVDEVSVEVRQGETFGLVGESGSGKTTLGKLVLRLIDPTEGRVWFEDQEVTNLAGDALRGFRTRAQMVFQDPYSSLNPRMKVRDIVGEPLLVHQGLRGEALDREVGRLLELVHLNPAQAERRPHEFSGGQRQRIGIARALALRPRLLILDEPTSALDVSVQAQVVHLLDEIRRELGLTYVFISHDLALVSLLCDRIGVMYLGRLVEVAATADLFRDPQHPYTQALLESAPRLEPGTLNAPAIGERRGAGVPPGCRFHPRCPFSIPGLCDRTEPALLASGPSRAVACHLHGAAEKADVA